MNTSTPRGHAGLVVAASYTRARNASPSRMSASASASASSLRAQYERQGRPVYSTARLWDDGVIDPHTDARRARRGAGGLRGGAPRRARLRRVPDVMAARGAQLTGLSRSLAISVALSARL